MQGESRRKRGLVGCVMRQDLGVVLCPYSELAGELALIPCQETELGIGNGGVSTLAIILGVIVAPFEAEQRGKLSKPLQFHYRWGFRGSLGNLLILRIRLKSKRKRWRGWPDSNRRPAV